MAWPCREMGSSCLSNNPNSQDQNCKAHLKTRWGRGGCWFLQSSWCENPFFLQLPTEVRSWCSCKPPTRYMLYFREELKQRIKALKGPAQLQRKLTLRFFISFQGYLSFFPPSLYNSFLPPFLFLSFLSLFIPMFKRILNKCSHWYTELTFSNIVHGK